MFSIVLVRKVKQTKMSFFIKAKPTKRSKFDKKKPNKRKTNVYSAKNNDDVTSSEDEDIPFKQHEVYSSSDEETVQERKVKLAKLYLKEIEKEEKARLEDDEAEVSNEVIAKKLKQDYLKQAGKLKTKVAEDYEPLALTDVRILTCREHRSTVTCLCVSSDSKHVFSGSKCGSVVKWLLPDGKKVASLPFIKKNSKTNVLGHTTSVLCIAISSNSKFLVTGDETNTIFVWDPCTLKHIHNLNGHRGPVTGLVFQQESHTLYSCSRDRSVKVWSLDEMAYVETLFGHQDSITSIDSGYKERAITSGGQDISIRLWKIPEESQLIYNGNSGSIDMVRLINEENFVSGGDDGQICIWSISKKKPLCTVKAAHGLDPSNNQPYWISAVGARWNTDMFTSGSQDGYIRIWNLAESFRGVAEQFKIPVTGFVNSLNFTPNGNFLLASVGREHRFGRWNVIKEAKNGVVIIALRKR